MTLAWIPEAYPASGTIGAAGFGKLLGRPEMDPLTVLVREAAQNSWDAHDSTGKPVRFSISGRTLIPAELSVLANSVFVDHRKMSGSSLTAVLAKPQVQALFLSDRQTLGLGGPLLASIADDSDVYDWVDFVLNVGKANTQAHTGGTYGFGKTITYVVSEAKSIVVHSRARFHGETVTRLMACAIGDQFSAGGKLFTGRHWWGLPQSGASTPIEGDLADELAQAIGMPAFEGDDLGTNILVLAPGFGDRTPCQAMNFIAETVLWHLWPKIVDRNGRAPMSVLVNWEGSEVPIPLPEDRPPLHGFVQAFQALLGTDVNDATPGFQHDVIARLRPKTVVGNLATVPMVVQPRAMVDDGHDPLDDESPPPAAAIRTPRSHHVALLRSPELVVQYLEGPPSPEGGLEWAGVFRAHDDHDNVFGLAEPPTHDSWRPDLLEHRLERSTVKKALQDIQAVLSSRWGERRYTDPTSVSSAAVVADQLAHLVGASAGSRTTVGPPREPVISPRTINAHLELLSSGPVEIDGEPGTQARVRIIPKMGTHTTRVTVSVGVALDGSTSDTRLDPAVRLAGAKYSGRAVSLSGTQAEFIVEAATPTDVEIAAARSAAHSLLFEVSVEAIPSGAGDQ